MGKQMTIFKLGTHLPNYTADDLAATVAAYDPAVHEAPIVVGHPRTDSPAFGWIESVQQVGGALMGKPKQVAADFSEWVKQGFWKKRSASFYPPGHADHPLGAQSQVYYLKHVGYLGANPPKVKGMPDFEFCETPEDGLLTIDFSEGIALDFSDWSNRVNGGLWRRLREWFIATEGTEKADELVPGYEIESLLSESSKNWELDDLRDRLQALESKVFPNINGGYPVALSEEELAKREEAIALRERSITLKEEELKFSEALEELVKEGKVLPVNKPHHLKRLKMLASIPSDNVADFSEGKTDYSPTQEYLDELKAGPVLVNYGEISPDEGKPAGMETDPTKRARAIEKHRAQAAQDGRALSFAEADAELRAESNGGDK
jgi:hypothetical protein